MAEAMLDDEYRLSHGSLTSIIRDVEDALPKTRLRQEPSQAVLTLVSEEAQNGLLANTSESDEGTNATVMPTTKSTSSLLRPKPPKRSESNKSVVIQLPPTKRQKIMASSLYSSPEELVNGTYCLYIAVLW